MANQTKELSAATEQLKDRQAMAQFLKTYNSDWIFKGFASVGDATPAFTLNHVYIPMGNGTIFGQTVSDYTRQVLVGDGSAFVVEVLEDSMSYVDGDDTTRKLNGRAIDSAIRYKADVNIGKNLIDKETFIVGYWIRDDGNIYESEVRQLSLYIPVKPSTDYIFNYQAFSVCFFNKSKVVVTGGVNGGLTTFTTSSDTYFVRVAIETYYLATFDVQLEEGSLSTEFEEYSETIAVNNLPIPVSEFDNNDDRSFQSGKAIDKYYKNPNVNKWVHTEDFSASWYTGGGQSPSDTVNYKGVTLTRVNFGTYWSYLLSNFSGLGYSSFTVGKKYLLSFYIMGATDSERFFWMRDLINTASLGHGAKLVDGKVRRVWSVAYATGVSTLKSMGDPSLLPASWTFNTRWLYKAQDYYTRAIPSGDLTADPTLDDLTVYLGGFQIEEIEDDNYVDGIALIGDSTMAGSADKVDNQWSQEVSRYIESLLNVNVFNRAVGGEKTSDMDSRWATDITPIAINCKYVIIQGGINDISQGRTLAEIQTSIQSMYDKAVIDGMIPIIATCTPSASFDATEHELRLALNKWILRTYPLTMDFAAIVTDPNDLTQLRSEWANDGVHYTTLAKRAIGNAVAKWSFWDFLTPKPYQQKLIATPTVEKPFDRKIGEIADVQGIDIFAESNELSISGRRSLI